MLIAVRVTTAARRESVVKENDSRYAVSVLEKPERGLANKRVLEIMRNLYPGKSVKLVHGQHSPSKIIEIGE
jgi:uncharacterized protein (TIGR00251 family)